MTTWIESWNALSGDWAGWIGRICWQGALVISVAWLITIILRNNSPRIRCWVWRIAQVKVLLLIVWATTVDLALLPPRPIATPAMNSATLAPAPPTNQVIRLESNSAPSDAPLVVEADNAVEKQVQSVSPSWTAWLFAVWSVGVIFVVVGYASEARDAARLVRAARAVAQPDLERQCQEVCRRLGVRRAVRLLASEGATVPLLVQVLSAKILLPLRMLEQWRAAELRLALAHEVAHLKRHDLAWNRLSALLRTLLYFHPFLWFAHRCERQEQEMACDEMALVRMGVDPFDYGQMLVKVVQRFKPVFRSGFAAVGVSSTYKSISRRLEAMKHYRSLSQMRIALAGGLIVLLGIVSMVPWRVVAQEKPVIKENRLAVVATTDATTSDKLSEGWRSEMTVSAGGERCILWVENGWLQVRQQTGDGDLDWQVVLAKASDFTPPIVSILDKESRLSPTLSIEYQGGRYFVKQDYGYLRIRRQLKTAEATDWPHLSLPDGYRPGSSYEGTVCGVEWNNKTLRVVASGPTQQAFDSLVVWGHAEIKGRSYAGYPGFFTWSFESGRFTDDGELLVAQRTPATTAKNELARLKTRKALLGSPAPEFDAKYWLNVDAPLPMTDLRGKVVLLDFWFSGCGPCVEKMPDVQKLYDKYQDQGLVVITVNSLQPIEKDNDLLPKFVKEHKIELPTVVDEGKNNERYGVWSVPACFLVDRQGKVAWSDDGPPTAEKIEELLGMQK